MTSNQQKKFIQTCQKALLESDENNITYLPPMYRNGKPNVSSWYLKPVILCAPHIQFNTTIPCPNSNCGYGLTPIGWCNKSRYVHDLNSGIYLSQFMYKCTSCESKNATNGITNLNLSTTTELDLLDEDDDNHDDVQVILQKKQIYFNALKVLKVLPLYMSNAFLIEDFKRSAYHYNVVNLIIYDSTTGKTFEEIQKTIAHSRVSTYLRAKISYESAVEAYLLNHPTQNPSEKPCQFTTMIEYTGYNENYGPTPETIIEFYKLYVEQREMSAKKFMESLPPFPVLSVDHTFNIQRRKTIYESDTTGNNVTKDPAYLVTLDGNGLIYAHKPCRENHNSVTSDLVMLSQRFGPPFDQIK